MNATNKLISILAASLAICAGSWSARADDLRRVKHGEPMPACRLPSLDGTTLESDALKGSVIVYVCISAEQNRSELAAADSQQVVKDLGAEPVRLVHITADVVKKAYFEKFRQEHDIKSTLAFDADRVFYGQLGVIAFPTTVIVTPDGKLDNVISLHGSTYKDHLDAYIRHALGKLSDKDLEQRMAAKPAEHATPKTAASAHRTLARLMRERGQYESAKTELNNGLTLDPGNNEILLDLAEIDIALGDLDGADAAVAKVLAAQADHRRAQQVQGVVLYRRGKIDEAQAILEKCIALNANPEVAHYYLGMICEKKGQKDKAIEHYREAAKRLMADRDPPPPAPEAKPAAPMSK